MEGSALLADRDDGIFQMRIKRMSLRWNRDAAGLAKHRQAVRVGAKHMKQGDRIADQLAVVIGHIEQSKAERKREQRYEIERIRRADRQIEPISRRRPERA